MYFRFVISSLAIFSLAITAYALSVQSHTRVVQTENLASTTSLKIVVATTSEAVRPVPPISKPKPKTVTIAVKVTQPVTKPSIVRSYRAAAATEATTTHVVVTATSSVVSERSETGSQIERDIHTLINTERTKAGLPTLTYQTTLANMARAHSTDMLINDYFEHTNQHGCTMSCRFQNIGFAYRAAGENIYMMEGYSLSDEASAEMIVNGWMESPGHRENILNPSYTTEGIGIAVSDKTTYATEDLAEPR